MAGSVAQFYLMDKRDPYLRVPYNGTGVSGVTGPSCVLTDYVCRLHSLGLVMGLMQPAKQCQSGGRSWDVGHIIY